MNNLNYFLQVFFIFQFNYCIALNSIINLSPIIKTDKTIYKPWENIEISFANLTDTSAYWIIYTEANKSNENYYRGRLVKGQPTGSLIFAGAPKGTYEVRVFLEKNKSLARYPFNVASVNAINIWEILKILISLILPGIAIYLLINYNNLIQKTEAGKSQAIGEVSFQYNASHNLHKLKDIVFLDYEIKIINVSSRKLGIPAVFVQYKPIIYLNQSLINPFNNFDSLQPFFDKDYEPFVNHLNKTRNIAAAKGFFWQTSVGGISVRRGYEIFPKQFTEKYPIIMLRIIIYGTSLDRIDKTSFPSYQIGDLRIEWCDYLWSQSINNYEFFSRLTLDQQEYPDGVIKKGERILVDKDGKIDLVNTIKFLPILRTIVSSFVEVVINFEENKSSQINRTF